MHERGDISGNGICNNQKKDLYMPCKAMAPSPKCIFVLKIITVALVSPKYMIWRIFNMAMNDAEEM